MTEPARVIEQSVLADPIEVFRVRGGCYAQLYRLGEYDLHEAVDYLQEQATVLIETIGQDAVQTIIASEFAAVRAQHMPRPSAEPKRRLVSQDGVASAAELQRDQDDAIARRGAPQVVLDALMWEFRQSGLATLDSSANRARLGFLSINQLDELGARMKGAADAANRCPN